jgi:putative serine protease PepD
MDVTAAGPADGAGLRVGDVIEAVDGKRVAEAGLSDFRLRLRTASPGSTVALTVNSGGLPRELILTLADQI